MIELLAGGGLVTIGILLGRYLPSRRSHTPKPPKPICGCQHALSFHDRDNGECHATEDVPTRWSIYGDEREWKKVQCTCRQYTGPTPLDTIYAPEITG